MRDVVYLPALKRDQVRMARRGKNVQKLTDVVTLLSVKGSLPSRYRAHKLQGEYLGYWECHLESDWLLVYALTPETVFVARTGTHSDLFE
jgi:mRNA interferase YafQ